MLPYRTYLPGFVTSPQATVEVLKKYGMEYDLDKKEYYDVESLRQPPISLHVGAVIENLIGKFKYDHDLWKDGQEVGLTWAPLRKPEENIGDEHWAARETFVDVDYPELGKTFTQVGAKWMAPGLPWRRGARAPLLDEHTHEVLAEIGGRSAAPRRSPAATAMPQAKEDQPVLSPRGKPFALEGVRVIDLSWLLASAGAGRFFSALGADVIKIEHSSKPDPYRMGAGTPPDGGREERDRARAR